MSFGQWDELPEDLRYHAKWCIAGLDKAPYTPSGHRASVTNPAHWADFYSAATVAKQWGANVGYVLCEDDPFTCIDLDVKDNTTQEQLDYFWNLVKAFDSYTEYSQSGRGLHIWVRGKVGLGTRVPGVEVYSQARYIICTGKPVQGYDKPIAERQEHLDAFLSMIRRNANEAVALDETVVEVDSDEGVYQRAAAAGNAEKFHALWAGDWAGQNYPSQSEADLSLMSMLAFYSKSNEQCRRLFRYSELGKRPKATKNNTYLNRTLKIIRSRQHAEDASKAKVQIELKMVDDPVKVPTPYVPSIGLSVEAMIDGLDYPPGRAGTIAQWMFNMAPRPVKEVAIVATLGFLAGVYGKCFNIPNSGLNLYIVLVARSAVGKEAMHSGISKLIHLLESGASQHVASFADFASGPALTKAIAENNCFVNVAGEFGRKLKRIADDKNDGAMSSLRTTMTNLYQKSAAGTIVGGIGYSDKEKNIASVSGVAYSMIGETTPETFYEALTNTMMQDGFMSRFIVIEYNGKRPALNPAPFARLDEDLLFRLNSDIESSRTPADAIYVEFDDEAKELMAEFDLECDKQINSTEDESWRQMWNRAHLKAMRIASVIGSINCNTSGMPLVSEEDAIWALDVVKRDIRIMTRKMNDGDVGEGDGVRERKILSVLLKYVGGEVLPTSYGVPEEMQADRVVPRSYLQIRTQKINSFINHRMGANAALDMSLKSLIDSGYIVEVQKQTNIDQYSYHGKAYRVLSIPRSITA